MQVSSDINKSSDAPIVKGSFEMKIDTERLSIREFTQDDRQHLIAMHQDQRVRRLLIDDQPLHLPSMAYAFIQRQQELYQMFPGSGVWCAEHWMTKINKKDLLRPEMAALSDELRAYLITPRLKFFGWFSLLPMIDDMKEMELGSRLLPSAWGKKFSLEGGELILEHGFDRLQCERIWIASHLDHQSVDYIAHALGFHRESVKPYGEHLAQYYVLYNDHWQQWKIVNRRERIRYGIEACKSRPSISKLIPVVNDEVECSE